MPRRASIVWLSPALVFPCSPTSPNQHDDPASHRELHHPVDAVLSEPTGSRALCPNLAEDSKPHRAKLRRPAKFGTELIAAAHEPAACDRMIGGTDRAVRTPAEPTLDSVPTAHPGWLARNELSSGFLDRRDWRWRSLGSDACPFWKGSISPGVLPGWPSGAGERLLTDDHDGRVCRALGPVDNRGCG
jgi:hypothetical protein